MCVCVVIMEQPIIRECELEKTKEFQGYASGVMTLKIVPLRNQQHQVTQIEQLFCLEFMHKLYVDNTLGMIPQAAHMKAHNIAECWW